MTQGRPCAAVQHQVHPHCKYDAAIRQNMSFSFFLTLKRLRSRQPVEKETNAKIALWYIQPNSKSKGQPRLKVRMICFARMHCCSQHAVAASSSICPRCSCVLSQDQSSNSMQRWQLLVQLLAEVYGWLCNPLTLSDNAGRTRYRPRSQTRLLC